MTWITKKGPMTLLVMMRSVTFDPTNGRLSPRESFTTVSHSVGWIREQTSETFFEGQKKSKETNNMGVPPTFSAIPALLQKSWVSKKKNSSSLCVSKFWATKNPFQLLLLTKKTQVPFCAKILEVVVIFPKSPGRENLRTFNFTTWWNTTRKNTQAFLKWYLPGFWSFKVRYLIFQGKIRYFNKPDHAKGWIAKDPCRKPSSFCQIYGEQVQTQPWRLNRFWAPKA